MKKIWIAMLYRGEWIRIENDPIERLSIFTYEYVPEFVICPSKTVVGYGKTKKEAMDNARKGVIKIDPRNKRPDQSSDLPRI